MKMSATKRLKTRSASLGNLLRTVEENQNPRFQQIMCRTPGDFIGRFKLVIIGDEGCGKTSLLNSFVGNPFQDDRQFIFEGGVVTLTYGTKQVDLVMWDLSGCNKYDGLRCQIYQDADLFLICFDIANKITFQNVTENWIPELALEEPNTPFLLVGCKNDLRPEKISSSPQRDDWCKITTKEEAATLAQRWGAKDYVECCAKTGHNVNEVFRLAGQVLAASVDDKSSNTLLFGLSRFTKRKSSELGEILHTHHYHLHHHHQLSNRRHSSSLDIIGASDLAIRNKPP